MPAPSKQSHLQDISNHITHHHRSHTAHHTNIQFNSLHTTYHHSISSHICCNTRVDIREDEDVDAAVVEATVEVADAAIIKGNKIIKLAQIIIKDEDNSKPGTKHHQTTNNVKVFTANQ